jgi:hypothetical protein
MCDAQLQLFLSKAIQGQHSLEALGDIVVKIILSEHFAEKLSDALLTNTCQKFF